MSNLPNQIPKHVAIIMDGNGRWAVSKGLSRIEGHKAGVRTVKTIVEEARRIGVRYLTLYTFSSENWRRPADEVMGLMGLLARHLDSELQLMLTNDIRLRVLGDLKKLPASVQNVLNKNLERTSNCKSMDLILALSYGSRDEIVFSTRSIIEKVLNGELKFEQVDAQTISNHLYAPDIPDPELLIRTSNEFRISNFLLWQIAYSEIVISSSMWPEFGIPEFHSCLQEYARRERRFGMTSAQIR